MEIITAFIVILIFVVPVSVAWVHALDKAVDNDEWERQREEDRKEEDREQAEYLRRYKEKQEAKRKRKERGRQHCRN